MFTYVKPVTLQTDVVQENQTNAENVAEKIQIKEKKRKSAA